MARKKKKAYDYESVYDRKRKYSIEEVRELWLESNLQYAEIGEWPRIELEDGITVTMKSDRYDNFFINGTDCAECGLKGQYFWLETFKRGKDRANMWHFNLYGINDEGKERMLTKDHVFPKSAGGSDSISNYQVLCERCNSKKSNKIV